MNELEHEIAHSLDAGDYARAATRLLEGYGGEILGFLVGRLRDETLASEAFSLFSENLWRGLPRFERRSSARVWAYTIARHAAIRVASSPERRRDRNVPISQIHELSKLEQRVRTETLRYLRTEAKDRVDDLRSRLPEEDRALLILRVSRQLEWEDIARVFLSEHPTPSPEALTKESARLRKRYQLVKEKIRKMATEEGFVDIDEP